MRILLLTFFLTGAVFAQEQREEQQQWRQVEIEIPFGQPLDLDPFGAPHTDFFLLGDSANSISFAVVDRGLSRTIAERDLHGRLFLREIPDYERRSVPRENGLRVQGTLSRLYPLYARRNLRIYFFDTLATRQNYRRIWIEYKIE